ncbi:hypothetical protein [Burkholderia sp. BCC0397]|uniref:hypothetical protein n=1 Tax=Burkholderia sp. BCC0397 TaxID=486876 RepID=UPI00158C19A5|nr:hypothetical protein [Burkholderia sp. BCC0397]
MKVGEEGKRNGADFTGTAARAGFRTLARASAFLASCAATRDAPRRDDRPNKKRARRGTEHKIGLCREIGDAGSARWHPVRPDHQFNM